ncbi:MAG: hypothetical protein IK025_04010 [Bacteroidales bacterium]|nr:hypothetical protein [Bacteroidales bacterium]
MATLKLTKTTTIGELKQQFDDAFGLMIEFYDENNIKTDAALDVTLGNLGLTTEGNYKCPADLSVSSFIEDMKQIYGLNVKVFNYDWSPIASEGLALGTVNNDRSKFNVKKIRSILIYSIASILVIVFIWLMLK